MNFCRKLVLVLALTFLPLQGMAATFSVLACLKGEEAHATHGHERYSHDGHEHDAHHGDGHDGPGGNHSDNSCCQHLISALPTGSLILAPVTFSERVRTPLPLHDLYLPDLPQRPPLA